MKSTAAESLPLPVVAFRRAVAAIGSANKTAKVISKSQQAISQRLKRRRPVWAEDVIALEAATGISRHELRPDIYPPTPPAPHRDLGAMEPAR